MNSSTKIIVYKGFIVLGLSLIFSMAPIIAQNGPQSNRDTMFSQLDIDKEGKLSPKEFRLTGQKKNGQMNGTGRNSDFKGNNQGAGKKKCKSGKNGKAQCNGACESGNGGKAKNNGKGNSGGAKTPNGKGRS